MRAPSYEGPLAADEPVIRTERFGFSYPGATLPAVSNLTFSVHRHEIFGFLRPSGAGTSTTQKNVLIGLIGGYQGRVTVLSRDLGTWDRSYYRRIAVAFEAANHYLKLTARENLQLFAGLYGGQTEKPEALLERVGLSQDADKRVGEFSKGMRGRLTLARHQPELLFLDEPTAGLDPVTARRIRQAIREARHSGATVFLTTHDMVNRTVGDAESPDRWWDVSAGHASTSIGMSRAMPPSGTASEAFRSISQQPARTRRGPTVAPVSFDPYQTALLEPHPLQRPRLEQCAGFHRPRYRADDGLDAPANARRLRRLDGAAVWLDLGGAPMVARAIVLMQGICATIAMAARG
jgi:ABC-type Na+ transport system ATPase subunit NatA